MQFLILFLAFLTGFAGLVYQVVWQKYVSIFLGSDALATSATLSVFFCCLAIGYLVFGSLIRVSKFNRISIYCYLELAIGVYGALSPSLFKVLTSIFPVSQSHFLHNILFCITFMGPPTILMGGTIPALTDGLSRSFEMSHRIHSWVYGSNTVGALIGILVGGFYMIEELGLPITLYVTAGLNLFVFVIGRASAKQFSAESDLGPKFSKEEVQPAQTKSKHYLSTLFLISFLSGFYTFSFENLFIRLTGYSLGSSNYSYTLIVAAFIASLALGSYTASLLSNDKSPSTLLTSQVIATAGMILLFLSVPLWPTWTYSIRANFNTSLVSFTAYHISCFLFFFSILCVPIGILGMNLPLVFDSAKQRSIALGETVGKIYFVNCIGCAAGAAFGGNIFFQFWNMSQVFKATIGILILTIPLCAWLVADKKVRSFGLGISVVLAILIFFAPPWQNENFIPGRSDFPLPGRETTSPSQFLSALIKNSPSKLIFSSSDPLAEVNVQEQGKNRNLWINASNNASTLHDSSTRSLAALTSISLAPKLSSVFVVGLGAGLSTSILSGVPEVQMIEVAELSRSVIRALPFFEEQNVHLKTNSHKVKIHLGDAYQILRSTDKKFDFIVAEPSHIWVPGVEKLYTYEFIKAASSKLTPGGVHAQWFPLSPMSEKTFLKVLKTFQSVYPNVTLWHAPNSTTLTIISSNDPIRVQAEKLMDRFQNLAPQLLAARIPSPEALGLLQAQPEGMIQALTHDQEEFYESEFPSLSYESGRSRYAGIFFDLDVFLDRNFFKLKRNFGETFLMAHERAGIKFSKADYDQILSQSGHFALLHSIRNRILWSAALRFPEKFGDQLSRKSTAFYKYILGATEVLPKIESDEDLQGIQRQYRKALMMFLDAQPGRFFQLFPEVCRTNGCSTIKLSTLVELNLILTEQLTSLSQGTPSEKQAKVDELFRQVKNATRL